MKNMSAVFLIMGTIAAVILMLQIAHIYVTKQKKRMAIERLLGMTKKQCMKSVMTGILILLFAGIIPGIIAGHVITKHVNIDNAEQEYFNKMYSNVGISQAENDVIVDNIQQSSIFISIVMGIVVFALGTSICMWRVYVLIQAEPMYLIGNENRKV